MSLPDNYGTPEYEAEWIRKKLDLPANATTSDLQGQMHVICYRAHGYQTYIAAHKCDDKEGEIARLTAEISRLSLVIDLLTAEVPNAP